MATENETKTPTATEEAKAKRDKAFRYEAVIAAERILSEHSDEQNPLSPGKIRTLIAQTYGESFAPSPDALRKTILPRMEACLASMSEREQDAPTDFALHPPCRLVRLPSKTGKTERYALTDRLFENFEIDFLVDLVNSAPFLAFGRSCSLANRIRSLQSRHARKSPVVHVEPMKGKVPTFRDLHDRLETLYEAIEDRRTISFDYQHYIAKPAGSIESLTVTLEKREGAEGRCENLSPYRLQFMDGQYYLLTNKGDRRKRDAFRVFRVDLMENIEITNGRYWRMRADYQNDRNADPAAEAERYFRGAVQGFGGKTASIELLCSKRALHYVIERFYDFPRFAIRPITVTAGAASGRSTLPYKVTFEAYPRGVELWVMRFLNDIKLVKPEASVERIVENMASSFYIDEVRSVLEDRAR